MRRQRRRTVPAAAAVTFLRLAFSFALLVGSASDTQADEMPVPANLQVALFKKIFGYDRELQARGSIEVVVVHGSSETAIPGELVKEFRAAGLSSRLLAVSELDALAGGVDVVYVSPGVDPGLVQDWCTLKHVLTVSGIPELAMAGKVSIGIGLQDRKPEILVHLRRVKAEGHELAAGLLNLATVIR